MLLAGLLLAGLGTCGYWLLFTQFMVYDDEGYVLWSLHNYFQEGELYAKVYSQYGPFIYTLYYGIHRLLGVTFNHETTRLLTLLYWVAASALAGLFTFRQTRSAVTTFAAIITTFGSLHVMTSEPIHPGGILVLMAALGAVLGAWAIEHNHHRTLLIIGAAIGTCMALTKINVGAFFLIAVTSWLAMNLAEPRHAKIMQWITAFGGIFVPFWLMNSLWPELWVAIFAFTFSLSALSLILLIRAKSAPSFDIRMGPIFLGTAVLAASVVLGSVWLRGTTLTQLWHGIVVAPLKQPLIYSHGPTWPQMTPWLASGLFLAMIYSQARHRPWGKWSVIAMRFALFLGYLLHTYTGDELALTSYPFIYGLPFIWVFLVPLKKENPNTLYAAKLWVGWIFLWQTLQAYPVAGSQMSWGSFLWVPLALIGCHEAIQFCADIRWRHAKLIKKLGASVILVYAVLLIGTLGHKGYSRYTTGKPLELKGAETLRIPHNITETFRIMDKNTRRHGGLLFSYPGMFSYNLWSEHRTPTSANVTHWFSLFSDDQQQEIIDQISADDRAVLIVQSFLIKLLHEQGFPPKGILKNYLIENFTPAFRIDSFEFWVKNGRSIASLSTAGLFTNDTGGDSILQLVTDATGVATTIEIKGLFHPYNRVIALPPMSGHAWEITPLNADNSPSGKTISTTRPIAINGITKIEIPIPSGKNLPQLDILKIVIKDESGAVLDSLRFSQ